MLITERKTGSSTISSFSHVTKHFGGQINIFSYNVEYISGFLIQFE